MSKGILLSGGMDSIALIYWKQPDMAFTIDYGQKPAQAEIRASTQVAKALNIPHYIISADCSKLGSGDLSDAASLALSPSPEWWPYRNQLLITLACMKGIAHGMTELMVGSVKTDGFHSDGTSGFYDRLNNLLSYQEGNIKLCCPAIDLTTVELIRQSKIPASLLLWAHSCHTANFPCGHCRGCYKYLDVVKELYEQSHT
ncbi:7-cyano-7-deazaguanine synthase [Larkinella sp. C7]|jgi:7-cyano-7-deazaguanine synthase|uniref:7-cyano-7-deazaguanine synthase n=1 Tax=Larkinella sp. C7 TaxID=2576607 RepID=UPI0011110E03|nr:7-cyano-7-deazaguanine synthase [Larkinella sp. C7]